MTNYWVSNKGHKQSVICLMGEEEFYIENDEYYNYILSKFPKNKYCNLKSIDDVRSLINKYDNWHKKVESDLEAMMFDALINVGLNPIVNPLLKDLVEENITIIEPISQVEKNYRLDQVLYFGKYPILLIEIDGYQHNETIYEDAIREKIISKYLPMASMIRIKSDELRNSPEKMATLIRKVFKYVVKKYLILDRYKKEILALDLDNEDIYGELKRRNAIFMERCEIQQEYEELYDYLNLY